MAKKKTSTDVPPAPTKDGSEFVFVLNYGLEPSERQRKALDDRAKGVANSIINGWLQDGEAYVGGRKVKVSLGDLRPTSGAFIARNDRGKSVIEQASAMGKAHADLYAKTHQAPIVVECDSRQGQSELATLRSGLIRIERRHWDSIQAHPAKALRAAIESGRILDPEKTEATLRSKDQELLEDIIIRTRCQFGLRRIHEREAGRANIRMRVIAACDRQGLRFKDPIDFAGERAKA